MCLNNDIIYLTNYTIVIKQLMKKLLLPLLLLVAVSANAAENPVLTIEGGKVQGVLADDHPEVFVYRGATAHCSLEGRKDMRHLRSPKLSGYPVSWWILYRVGLWQRGRFQ